MGERLLDVRELEPPEPLERVLELLDTLAVGDSLRMLHRRQPNLLYPILEREGFAHLTTTTAEGDFEIRIWRKQV
ncbi:MAG: DUF2249 domain-containing protein [Sulfuricellaceae bacterium]|jgi:uncharacterized protein (DUF2249 family)